MPRICELAIRAQRLYLVLPTPLLSATTSFVAFGVGLNLHGLGAQGLRLWGVVLVKWLLIVIAFGDHGSGGGSPARVGAGKAGVCNRSGRHRSWWCRGLLRLLGAN